MSDSDSSDSSPRPLPQKPHKEFAKFNAHSKGIGLKLMQKMGYKVGSGLGQDGKGIVNPIDVKCTD